MSEERSLIERNFPIEGLNALVKKVTHPAARAPIYNMHKWWARRSGPTFRAITLLTFLKEFEDIRPGRLAEIDEATKFNEWFWGIVKNGNMVKRGIFYSPIDLGKKLGHRPIVLDPFMGGGTTVIEAIRLGCKVIGIDLIPVAWFVTKKEVEQVNSGNLDKAFQELEQKVAAKIKRHYQTICPKCLGEGRNREDSKVDMIYTFWVKKLPCITCGEEVKLFRSYVLTHPKGKRPTVFCRRCGNIFEARAKDLKAECDQCGFSFIPNEGSASPIDKETGRRRGGVYLCSNGHAHRILDATRRLLHKRVKKDGIWYPEEAEIYAAEYFCPKHGRDYKMADEYDKAQYTHASKAFRRRVKESKEKGTDIFGTLVPSQEIPTDKADPRPNNYGYRFFWQMFNERQLYSLSVLLENILEVKDQKVKEFLLMVFSDILNYNNTFCAYNSRLRVITDLFSRHGYPYKASPVENNVWGVVDEKSKSVGTGSFRAYFLKSRGGLDFQRKPFERYLVEGKTKKITVKDSVDGILARSFEELVSTKSNVILRAIDSQNLSFIPDGKVDAVITDPPYYDNVMYGELADFYYVWLRLGLKEHYEQFKPLYTSKSAEIVVNRKLGKTHGDYIRMLSNVFEECNRVLKYDGLMVLTYHHKKPETWAAILEAVLKPGFYIVATYPIYSEMKVSTHIRARGAREFDTIVVARKKKPQGTCAEGSEPVSWEKLKDEIYIKARDMIARVKESHSNLTNGDVATVVLGECLEIYSKYYPNIRSGSHPVEVPEAFEDIRDIISDLRSAEAIPRSDRITELYLRHLARRNSIEYNELLKIVQSSEFGVSVEHLKGMNILTQRGNLLIIVDPIARGKWLSENLDLRRKKLEYYIDAIHYLYDQYREGKRLPDLAEMGEFSEAVAVATLSYMTRELRDETYKKILDLVKAEKEPQGLERWVT